VTDQKTTESEQTGQDAAGMYWQTAMELLGRLRERESAHIDAAAGLCADRIAKGGLVFLFGNGHSRMM